MTLSQPQQIRILKEIKKILISENSKDEDVVSLYDIKQIVKKKYDDYEQIIRKYNEKLTCTTHSKISNIYDIDIDKNNCDNNKIKINFICNSYEVKRRFPNFGFKIKISKENGDLHISESSDYYYIHDILKHLGNDLSELYDKLIEYNDYKKQLSIDVKTNSIFYAFINRYGVRIYLLTEEFELRAPNFTNEYRYKCNSNNLTSNLKGKESEILKKIYVKIEDCPEWSRPILYKLRKEQIDKELKKEYIKIKRSELKRKIFPFLKK